MEDLGALTPEEQRQVNRALGYPYERPTFSFVYHQGIVHELHPDPKTQTLTVEWDGVRQPLRDVMELGIRVPVVGYGSNGAPERLQQKFGKAPQSSLVPVTMAVLQDFDVVYGAQITGYGSIPATLQHSKGCQTPVVVNWLDQDQLELMHQSEQVGINYDFCELQNISLQLADGEKVTRCFTYLSRHGVVLDQGLPIALAVIPSQRRRFSAQDQLAVQRHLQSVVAASGELDRFVLGQIGGPGGEERMRRMQLWQQQREFFRYPAVRTCHELSFQDLCDEVAAVVSL